MVLDPKAAAAAGGSSDPAKQGSGDEGAKGVLTVEDVDKKISEGVAKGIEGMMPELLKRLDKTVTGSTARQLGEFTKSIPELVNGSVVEALKAANEKPAPEPTDFQALEKNVEILQTSLNDSIAREKATGVKAAESDRKTAINLMLGETKIKGDLANTFNALVVNGLVVGIKGKPEMVDEKLVYKRDGGNIPAETIIADFLKIEANSNTWVGEFQASGGGAGGSTPAAGAGGGKGDLTVENFDSSSAGHAATAKALKDNPEKVAEVVNQSNLNRAAKLNMGDVWGS